jgi:TolA-binding protein
MTQSESKAGFCTVCGAAISESLRFCTSCGAARSTVQLQAKEPASTSQPATPAPGPSAEAPSKRKPNPFVVAVVCLVGVAGSLQLAGAYDIRDLWSSKPSSDSGIESVLSAAEDSYLQGTKYMNSGSYSEALECFEAAIRTYGDYSEAWDGKGEALEGLGREAEALACFQTAVRIDPEDCSAWINEGNSLKSLGRPDEAMSCYSRALQIEPGNSVATQSKQALLDTGIADNSDSPPAKQYDDAHPLRVTGGWGSGNEVIRVRTGQAFETACSVEEGQPPYYWYLVSGAGVAESIYFEPSADGSSVTVHGVGAPIDSSTTTKRQAQVEIVVEDSSQPTRWRVATFWLTVERDTDDSAIAAEVAREWHQNNYGDISGVLQQAVAGLGSGTATVSYSSPIRRSDGYYEVTDTVTLSIGAQGQNVYVSMDCVLVIDAKSRMVVNVAYGAVRTSY